MEGLGGGEDLKGTPVRLHLGACLLVGVELYGGALFYERGTPVGGTRSFDVDVEGLGGGEGLWKLFHAHREEPVVVFRVDRFLSGLKFGV